MAAASSVSLAVRAPSLWVESTSLTLFQRMSMFGVMVGGLGLEPNPDHEAHRLGEIAELERPVD